LFPPVNLTLLFNLYSSHLLKGLHGRFRQTPQTVAEETTRA
jgi:hypothetical protein